MYLRNIILALAAAMTATAAVVPPHATYLKRSVDTYSTVPAIASPLSYATPSKSTQSTNKGAVTPIVSQSTVVPTLIPVSSPASTTNNSTPASSFEQVVYWGQMDSERSLGEYCNSNEGIDILILSAVKYWGDGHKLSGHFGSTCLNTTTQSSCPDLEKDIQTCKKAGKKIFAGLGGSDGKGPIASQQEGEQVAQGLWDSYGGGKGANRPFGQQIVDGFDFDIESINDNDHNENFKYVVNKLRALFAQDTQKKYQISGAPQCFMPEPNMGNLIDDAAFDMLWIQFYNNPSCSANANVDYDAWSQKISTGASKGAKIFMGFLAGPKASVSHPESYIPPSKLSTLVNTYKTHRGFAGVMLWDAGTSDLMRDGGCTYAQNVRSILDKGKTC